MPFGALSGVGENAAIALAEARNGVTEFVSIDDFAQKAGASSSTIEMLRQVGAFAGLPETRQMSLFEM
jgi:DNA polymerase-3 subunit alpha (Gram-positive type)